MISVGHEASDGRGVQGGLHIRGLCVTCNGLAGAWDPAYADLHRTLGPPAFAEGRLVLPRHVDVPDTPIAVGAAARSMLAAASALNPLLRERGAPELAPLLLQPEPFEMPEGLDLRLGWGVGRQARINGSVAGQYVLGYEDVNRTIGNMTAAQCHYAPIAWQLLHTGETDLADHQGWPSISHWTTFDTSTAVALDSVCGPLPVVWQPRLHPAHGDGWIEMSSDQNCHIALTHDIAAVGRNDPCPCGSGDKFKRCCGRT